MTKGNLIIIAAPSGAGKSSLVQHALKSVARVCYSVSYTTRPRRGTEVEGVDYHFVSGIEFLRMRDAGEFLEYAEVHGFFYGTNHKAIETLINEGLDVLLDIDVQGAAQIIRQLPDAVTVFLLPPSRDVLESRLRARQLNTEEDLNRRLQNARQEVKRFEEFEYIIVNDDLQKACQELEAIILAERQTQKRQQEIARTIIDTFGG
jgi:guanylate kinase